MVFKEYLFSYRDDINIIEKLNRIVHNILGSRDMF